MRVRKPKIYQRVQTFEIGRIDATDGFIYSGLSVVNTVQRKLLDARRGRGRGRGGGRPAVWWPHCYFCRRSFVLTADQVAEILAIFSFDASLTAF